MEYQAIRDKVTQAMCQMMTDKNLDYTVENLVSVMINSGLVPYDRARQFLAVWEYYHGNHRHNKKSVVVEFLADKYKVSDTTLWRILGKERRFKV